MTTPQSSQPAQPAQKNTGWCEWAGGYFPWPGDCPFGATPIDPAKILPNLIEGAGQHVLPDAGGGGKSFSLGDVISSAGKALSELTSPAFWKALGLVVLAIGVGALGLVLWLGKGQDVEKAAAV